MSKIKARVVTAQQEDELPPMGEEFDVDAPTEFTDEDAQAEANEMSEKQRGALEASRKRGTAARAGRQGHRTSEARVSRERKEHDFTFRPLNSLDAPPPRQGMEQRWIRVMVGDKQDIRNWSKQSRYRWTPRKLETVEAAYNVPTQQLAGIGDVIMVGDLMLCERPAEIGRARRKFMEERHRKQIAATKRHVAKVERDDHPIRVTDREDMPPTVGVGRRVRAQDD